ncbi:MAG: type II secretion system protein GspN [Synergistaceae bacterium]|nr:type II secretion system protein GspN [Synergistaceae bacterium]
MKKFIRYSLAALLGLICGLLLFFPWTTLAGTISSLAATAAAENGIYLTVGSSRAEGILFKKFSYSAINADFPVLRGSLRELTVAPSFISSLFSDEKSARLTFGRGSVVPVTRQELNWNAGAADVILKAESLLVENISFTGESSLSGFAELSRSDFRIIRANLLVKVPAELDRMLEMMQKTNMIPLTKVKSGEWRIERK